MYGVGLTTVKSYPLGHCYWTTTCRQPPPESQKLLGKPWPFDLPLTHIQTWSPFLNLQENLSDPPQISANSPPTQLELPMAAKTVTMSFACSFAHMLPLLLPPASTVSESALWTQLSFLWQSATAAASAGLEQPGHGCSLDGNNYQSRETPESWTGPILPGQAQGSIRNPMWPWQTWGRLSEGCLHAPRESFLLCWLLLQNTAVEISTCYKKIRRLDEGSKDKQAQCCKPAARSLVDRVPFSWRVHVYHCCIG